ncbi:hypothetical protein D6792_01280 [Candidatus Parcubacteria bacterium]|nr:MAG: hypothetical protein D6792_01280 [Candidatus Parcubacteria bacterium]
MDKEKRRLIATGGAVVAGVVAALLGWLFFFGSASQEAPQAQSVFPEVGERSIAAFERQQEREGEGGFITSSAAPERQIALLQLWDKPVSALGFWEGSARGWRARFVERESGDIYETDSARLVARIYNTATPASQRGWFSSRGDALALQFLPDGAGTLATFEGPLRELPEQDPDTGSLVEFASAPLPRGVVSFAYDPSGSGRFAYLERLEAGGVRLVVRARGEAGREVWRSEVRGWHIVWTGPREILVVANTQPDEEGVAILIDPQTGAQRLAVSDNTLDALINPAGSKLVFSARRGRVMRLFVHDLSSHETIDTGLSTIAQKCVWGGEEGNTLFCAVPRSGVEPDNIIFWYQGGGYFDDQLVMIDGVRGEWRLLLDPREEYQAPLDVVSVATSAQGDALLLLDKRTLTPWVVRLDVLLKGDVNEPSGEAAQNIPSAQQPQEAQE